MVTRYKVVILQFGKDPFTPESEYDFGVFDTEEVARLEGSEFVRWEDKLEYKVVKVEEEN